MYPDRFLTRVLRELVFSLSTPLSMPFKRHSEASVCSHVLEPSWPIGMHDLCGPFGGRNSGNRAVPNEEILQPDRDS